MSYKSAIISLLLYEIFMKSYLNSKIYTWWISVGIKKFYNSFSFLFQAGFLLCILEILYFIFYECAFNYRDFVAFYIACKIFSSYLFFISLTICSIDIMKNVHIFLDNERSLSHSVHPMACKNIHELGLKFNLTMLRFFKGNEVTTVYIN